NHLVVKGIHDLPSPELGGTLQRQIAALPGVRGAALSSDGPPLESNNNSLLYPTSVPTDEKYVVETLAVDYDFFSVYGVSPVAGRLFSAEFPGDLAPERDPKDRKKQPTDTEQSIVINQALAAKLGAKRPE